MRPFQGMALGLEARNFLLRNPEAEVHLYNTYREC